MSKTKEHEKLKNVNDFMENIYKNAAAQGVRRDQVVFGKNIADMYNQASDAYNKKYKEIGNKYADEMASTTLKSLGYKDTKAGRDWLKKQNFMDW